MSEHDHILRPWHLDLGARFGAAQGIDWPLHYGGEQREWAALASRAALLDLSFRGRLCLLGADRVKFLNGQVTNNVKDLRQGEGCYAALVTAKGKFDSDLHIYNLGEELLLDFEPGMLDRVTLRLEKFIIADDVQIADVTKLYGLLSIQGPDSPAVLAQLGWPLPEKPRHIAHVKTDWGEVYAARIPRAGSDGYDLYIPTEQLPPAAEHLLALVKKAGGAIAGWNALETARIEAGIPRFGVDMDETNLAPEVEAGEPAISYNKGCYIGQEVIARIRTYGQVTKRLRKLAFSGSTIPQRGDKLMHGPSEAGYVTSACWSPRFQTNIGLGYVRREIKDDPTLRLKVQTHGEELVECALR